MPGRPATATAVTSIAAATAGPVVAATPQAVQGAMQAHCVIGAELAGLPAEQKLERSMQSTSMFGVLCGAVGTPQARSLPDVRNAPGGPVADYPFTPRAFNGRAGSPQYEIGRPIALRVPTDRQDCVGQPVLAAGDEIYAVVRDRGGMAGGDTASVLVVTSATDVSTVRAGSVPGHGAVAGFSEPVDRCEALFHGRCSAHDWGRYSSGSSSKRSRASSQRSRTP